MNNIITQNQTDVEKIGDFKINNWYAFLWYITQHIHVIDFGKNWFQFYSMNDRSQYYTFRKIIKEYKNELHESNYNVDKTNNLYLDHHRGVDIHRNKDIIERLVKL